MNRNMAIIVLILAVALGMTAVVLVNRWLSAQASLAAGAGEAVPIKRIVVAAQEIYPGARLTAANLELADWPQANVPKGAFESIDALKERIAVSRVAAGQPLLAAELAAPGSGAGLVAIIAPGMRAMAIRVDEVIGVGGFILPNTHVDVIGVQEPVNGRKEVETILKRIKVLAIAQETQTEEGQARLVRTVTLEVRPRDAERLALQVNQGPIHLVLRNPLEDELVVPPPAPKAEVRRVAMRQAPPPAPAPAFRVELIQGDREEKTYTFPAR